MRITSGQFGTNNVISLVVVVMVLRICVNHFVFVVSVQ